MTDSPIPGRHRNKEGRGLIGPIVSALAVLLAIGPVAWLLTSQDGSTVADGREDEKVLKVAEDNSGPAALDASTEPDDEPSETPDVSPMPSTPASPATSRPATRTPATPRATPTPTRPAKPRSSTTPTRRKTTPAGDRTTPTRTSSPSRSSESRRPKPRRQSPTTTTTTSTNPPAPPTGGGGTNAQEQQVLELTNAQRRQHGCGALSLDSSLVEAAGRHASDMVRRKYFDHTSPDGKSPFDRMKDAGYRGSSMGENIAVGYGSPQAVVDGWMKSEGHRKNILNCDYNRLGVGYDSGQVKPDWGNGSWVQNFGRS